MIIRRANHHDIADILALCKEFSAISTFSGVEFVDENFRENLSGMIDSKSVFVVNVATRDDKVVGTCCFMVTPPIQNHSHLIANECWWYVTPEMRTGTGSIRLLKQSIDDCIKLGAKSIVVTSENHLDKRVPEIYKRLGFLEKETSWIMERV
jgi:N-acetylglutamate synthase-like GNAT family acetyltransferase